jgi:DNA-binding transcriptional MerR regulator
VPDTPPSLPAAVGDGLDVGLGVAAVARRIGVAPGTLRTWARRYGIGPTGHVAGTQRRYTSADLARLSLMRRLMLEGVTPADAARAALEGPVNPARRALRRARDRARDVTSASAAAAADAGRRSRAGGGGRVVALRDASPAARGLARAAMTLDPAACSGLLATSLARRGVIASWQDMVLPVLVGLGERWRATGRGVEVEHLLTECVEDELRATTRRLSAPRNVSPVLLAAPAPEEHSLALHAVAAALAERRVGVRMFGAGVPLTGLAEAVTRTGAAVVFLWAQGAGRWHDPAMLDVLPGIRPHPLVVLGGPGWLPPDGLQAGALAVRRVDDLSSAVEVVLVGLGLTTPQAR